MKQVRFTKEEKELDRTDIKEMLLNGISCNQIAKDLGRSVSYVTNVRDKLIDEDEITQDEIDEAIRAKEEKKQREFDKKVEQMLESHKSKGEISRTLHRSYKDINAAIERIKANGKPDIENIPTEAEIEKEKNKKEITNEIKAKSYTSQIAKKLHIPKSTVEKYIEELIDEGKIHKEDVLNGHKNKGRKKKSEKTDEKIELNAMQLTIIEHLKKGFSYYYIYIKLGLTQQEFVEKVKELKETKVITQENINKAREEREQKNRKKVLNYLTDGYSKTDIANKIQDMTLTRLYKIIKDLIADNEITQENIEYYRIYGKHGKANENKASKKMDTEAQVAETLGKMQTEDRKKYLI